MSAVDAEMIYMRPRGIGLNWIPCFICSGGYAEQEGKVAPKTPVEKAQPDMASFVHSREDGERILSMFNDLGLHAHLDYRPHEPQWIQVKIGACENHRPNLDFLGMLVSRNDGVSEDMIRRVLPGGT